jgi:hypothetical protein
MATIAHGNKMAGTGAASPAVAETNTEIATRYVFAFVRLALGWTFLWAFLDKMFGLGHETTAKSAWINGGHPTLGFLNGAAGRPVRGLLPFDRRDRVGGRPVRRHADGTDLTPEGR